MPRRARLAVAGIPWHIIQRGNNRSACFYCEDDFRFFLDTLFDQAKTTQCQIHAYVLMTNHVHLLITPTNVDGPSIMMKHLGQRYAQYINRTYRRTGTLWEGRFRSCLAQSQFYVLACYRYIELNPVRAGIVPHPRGYAWSSYHHNGGGVADPLITPHADYSALSQNNNQRQEAYRQMITANLDDNKFDDIRGATNGNFIVGNDRFKKEIAQMLGRRVTPGQPGRPKRN